MKVKIIEDLSTTPVARSTYAPWLAKNSIKSVLNQDFIFTVDDETYVIPKGYVTDLSSIPRVGWLLYPPNYGESRRGATAHDFFYSHLHWIVDKEFADNILIAFMDLEGAPGTARYIFHKAVHHFGRGGWHHRDSPESHPHWRTHHERIPNSLSDPLLAQEIITL